MLPVSNTKFLSDEESALCIAQKLLKRYELQLLIASLAFRLLADAASGERTH
jgi:hypothetical protein